MRYSTTGWSDIYKNRVLGPVFSGDSFNGHRYLQMLQNILPNLLNDIPLSMLRYLRLQHDGVPTHKSMPVRRFIADIFGENIAGYSGGVEWLQRSPFLNLMDFFFSGS